MIISLHLPFSRCECSVQSGPCLFHINDVEYSPLPTGPSGVTTQGPPNGQGDRKEQAISEEYFIRNSTGYVERYELWVDTEQSREAMLIGVRVPDPGLTRQSPHVPLQSLRWAAELTET